MNLWKEQKKLDIKTLHTLDRKKSFEVVEVSGDSVHSQVDNFASLYLRALNDDC